MFDIIRNKRLASSNNLNFSKVNLCINCVKDWVYSDLRPKQFHWSLVIDTEKIDWWSGTSHHIRSKAPWHQLNSIFLDKWRQLRYTCIINWQYSKVTSITVKLYMECYTYYGILHWRIESRPICDVICEIVIPGNISRRILVTKYTIDAMLCIQVNSCKVMTANSI